MNTSQRLIIQKLYQIASKYNYVLTLELQKKILPVRQKKVIIVTALTSNVLLSNPVKLLEKLYVQKNHNHFIYKRQIAFNFFSAKYF